MIEMHAFAPEGGEVWARVSALNSGTAEMAHVIKLPYREDTEEEKSLVAKLFCLFSIISPSVFLFLFL